MNRFIKKTRFLLLFFVLLSLIFFSCEALYTTSVAKPFERKKIDLSKKPTTSLVNLAKGNAKSDPKIAKEILDSLSKKPKAEILALSPEDKEAILDLTLSASVDLESLISMIGEDDGDEFTLDEIFDAFDLSIDLGVVEVILSDSEGLDDISANSIAIATLFYLADTLNEIDDDDNFDFFELFDEDDQYEALDSSSLDDNTKDKLNLVLDIMNLLEDRDDEINIPGFDF